MNLNDGRVSLPLEWTNHFYEVVKQHNKYCVIIFSRHTVPKKGIEIQGLKCESVGRDVIHEKYLSKTWHEKLKNVPDESFEAGNITEAGCSKASYKTIKSEQVAKSYPDKDLVQSISKLKEKYNSEMGSTVKGFIQYFSVEPFTVGLWTQKDIEFYHKVGSFSPLLCDATGKVCANVNGKSILYYTYIPQEYDLKVEPTSARQILTDCLDGTPLIWCLERFIKEEQKCYGFKAKTVPPLFICDVSWPIIKVHCTKNV